MWTKIKWGLRVVALLFIGAFLHYTLPQHDVVQIINTYNKNTPIGANWMFYSIEDTGTGVETTSTIRDIRFIDAVYPDGTSVMVYRNEDTGWFWPPYFKWDSSTLQAEAQNLKSDKSAPAWVSITHYGWRMPIFSIFPNAVSVTPVAGPDVTIIPWVNIILLVFLLLRFRGGILFRLGLRLILFLLLGILLILLFLLILLLVLLLVLVLLLLLILLLVLGFLLLGLLQQGFQFTAQLGPVGGLGVHGRA